MPHRKIKHNPPPIPKAKGATCHPAENLYAKGLCRSCYEKQLRQINPKFAERQRKNAYQWALKHKEQKRKLDKAYKAKLDPEYNWARTILRHHGITAEQYYAILKKQKGCCAICKIRPKPKKHLAIDHNHKTGEIRGLLCFRCNYGLSWFSEKRKFLQRAVNYVTQKINFKSLS